MSKTAQELVHDLCELREKRSEISKLDADLKAQFDASKAALIERLNATGASAASGIMDNGRTVTASLTMKAVPRLDSWETFSAYIIKTGQLDLLEKRVSRGGVKERWQSGTEIPGLSRVDEQDISLTTKKAAL